MPEEDHSASTSDSLFGNNASDLLRAAMDQGHGRPATPPAGWQPPQPEELQAMLPQYEVSAFLGRGGMGAVYRGRQLSLERPVAIKILPPGMADVDASYAERFRHEAMALARLRHLSIVAVYDFGQTQDGMFYIAMELIEGTDVAHMVAQQGRLHSDHAMAITAHVCDALQYAHGQKIIHRDIKPSNIMVAYDGTVKVTDFGLAKILLEGQPGLTRSGMALGTLQYMAPEALTLGAAVDHRADIYAVGVMLYHMLTGLLPQGMFELPSLQVPGLDPRYDTIVARALRNDREQRYQSAYEMRRDLDAVLTQPISQVASASAPPTASPPQRPPQTRTEQSKKENITPKPKKSSALVWVFSAVIGAGIVSLPWVIKPGAEKQDASAHENAVAKSSFAHEFTKDNPFTNSLGMKFVPVPGTQVLMCIHETCASDYDAFSKNIPATQQRTHSKTDKPMEAVTINMANAFCAWLSDKDGRTCRLPTEQEWNFAAGTPLSEQPVKSILSSLNGIKPAFQTQFPWGDQWPPPPDSGNYLDTTLASVMKGVPGIEGYNDGYGNNAPAMSFKPNALGIYDLGGNVSEWCVVREDGRPDSYVLKGGSFVTEERSEALSSFRTETGPIFRKAFVGFRCVIDTASSPPQTLPSSGRKAQSLQEWTTRSDPRKRLEMLRTYGGRPECEAAVSAAFDYLKQKQNPNGSWGTTDQVGSTALALLAYLGRGETPQSTSYGDTIMKAIMFLMETSKKNTEGVMATNVTSPHAAAEHGMATHALGELYQVARRGGKTLPGMREAWEKGIRNIIKNQLSDGGWNGQEGGTGFSAKGIGSPFVSAWQCEALATAKLTSLTFDGLNTSIPKAADFMLTFQIVGQRRPPPPPETLEAMTGACLRALQITSSSSHAEFAAALSFSRGHFQNAPLSWERADLYSWLFYTRAFFREGGEYWLFWNKQMLPHLLEGQKNDGSWQRPSAFAGGSEFDSTALCALMLETYYRDVMIGETGKTTQPAMANPVQANSGSPPAPAAVVQSPSSTQPTVVKLDFLASGAEHKTGYYHAISCPTTAASPPSILKMPDGIAEAEYGEIKMGPDSSKRTYAFIVDRPDGPSPRLFVDSNANGDLTDDAPATWKLTSSKGPDGEENVRAYGDFKIELKLNDETLVSQIRAGRQTRKAGQPPVHEIYYYSDYARTGSVSLGGKTFAALLTDYESKGDFSAPSNKFHLDINGNGRFGLTDESFKINDAFNIGGTTYQISGLTPSGAAFQIIKSSLTVPETKPKADISPGKIVPSFDATTLTGEKISVPGSYKGKMFVLAFWDTADWRCKKELPNTIAAYEKHHAAGLEFLGINMDAGDSAKKLPGFLKENNMNWPQICDGKGTDGAIAQLYSRWFSLFYILADGDTGKIIGLGLSVADIEPAIIKALAEKKR